MASASGRLPAVRESGRGDRAHRLAVAGDARLETSPDFTATCAVIAGGRGALRASRRAPGFVTGVTVGLGGTPTPELVLARWRPGLGLAFFCGPPGGVAQSRLAPAQPVIRKMLTRPPWRASMGWPVSTRWWILRGFPGGQRGEPVQQSISGVSA